MADERGEVKGLREPTEAQEPRLRSAMCASSKSCGVAVELSYCLAGRNLTEFSSVLYYVTSSLIVLRQCIIRH